MLLGLWVQASLSRGSENGDGHALDWGTLVDADAGMRVSRKDRHRLAR